MGYRIKTVARLTGVPRNTLLAWERRYNLVSPDRAENGYREYTEAEVARIAAIKRLIEQGYKVSEAISLTADGVPPLEGARSRPQTALSETRERMTEALLRFDREAAMEILDRLPPTRFQSLVEELYLPMLMDVGELWEDGEITIAAEHFASAFCRERLVGMLTSLGHGPEGGPLHICAGIAGERHEGGLLGLAIRLALSGARVSYLGPDLPVADLISAAVVQGPVAVCLSASGPVGLDTLTTYVDAARQGLPPGVRICVGGGAVARNEPSAMPGVEWYMDIESFFQQLSEAAR